MLHDRRVIQNGYVVDEQTLALAPVGSSREQVLLSLGSPSATATFDTEVFYYISQKRTRAVAFMKPRLVEQTRPGGLFRQGWRCRAARQLHRSRTAGSFDMMSTHDADRRRRPDLPAAPAHGRPQSGQRSASVFGRPAASDSAIQQAPVIGRPVPDYMDIAKTRAGSLRRAFLIRTLLIRPGQPAAAGPRYW